jgi:hypothetical protein
VVVIFEYLRRRVLGLPPFGDDGNEQFVAPAPQEKVKPMRRPSSRAQEKRIKDL